MNAERLLAHYNRAADAPDAVARLRRFVLDLAVRGKLVEQDPEDEPASLLLKRIAAEKARLVEAKEIRKPKAVSLLKPDDFPFVLPHGWARTQIAQLGVISPRNNADDELTASFVPMPMISAQYGVANGHAPRPWGEIKKGYTHFAEGDIGLAKITPCFENGKSTIFENLTGGLGAGTTELHVLRPLYVDARYIVLFLKSPNFIENGIPSMTGTAGQKRVPTEYFTSSPFPLPPLTEQRRIVARVKELMALLDQLEAARNVHEATRDRLTVASLDRLIAPGTTSEDVPAHARFALDALPVLTTRADQIKLLRQTILNLAVRGKLVEQDPAESVVDEYAGRVDFEWLPKTWSVLNFGQHCDIEGGNQPPKSQFVDKPRPGYVRLLQIRDLGDKPVPVYIPEGSTNRFCRVGEILIGRYGASVGKIFWAQDGAYNVALTKFVWPKNSFVADFAFVALKSNLFQSKLLGASRSAQAGFNKGDLREANFPLPPLAEQTRIVAKVDTLMALCDRMESALSKANATRTRFLDALIHEALSPAALDDRETAA